MTDRRSKGSSPAGASENARVPVRPSTVTLPECAPAGVRTLLDFFVVRFPRIPRSRWFERFANGKIWTADGTVAGSTPFRPLLEVHYRREVDREPPVREDFRVVWADHHLVVVDKPPNLPVTPGGRWVRGCLLHLLAGAIGNDSIAPLHRLDRLTSGLVLLSLLPATRSHYARLFQPAPLVDKVYTAVSELHREPPGDRFILAHHVCRSPVEHWRQIIRPELTANARCEVEVLRAADGLGLLRVRPLTGRKHQLRVQLAEAGLPILGDPLYGTAPAAGPDDDSQRLWLDGHRLSVHRFTGADGSELNADWVSSRPPEDFFRRAASSRRH